MSKLLLGVFGFLLAGSSWAGNNGVMIDKVWMRESVPGQASVTVQMNVSTIKPARILSVSSPIAESGEIQGVVMYRGKMQTKTVDSMKMAAHSQIIFGTRGMYLVLNGLKQSTTIGEKIPVTLQVEVGGKKHNIEVQAEVKALELSYKHYNDPTVKDHR